VPNSPSFPNSRNSDELYISEENITDISKKPTALFLDHFFFNYGDFLITKTDEEGSQEELQSRHYFKLHLNS